MKMEVFEQGETSVWIRLEGRLDLKGVEEIQLGFTVKASRSEKPVVIDLRDVAYVGSLGIALIIEAAKKLRLRRSRLILFGARPHIDELLRTAGVNELAELMATEDDARSAVLAASGTPG